MNELTTEIDKLNILCTPFESQFSLAHFDANEKFLNFIAEKVHEKHGIRVQIIGGMPTTPIKKLDTLYRTNVKFFYPKETKLELLNEITDTLCLYLELVDRNPKLTHDGVDIYFNDRMIFSTEKKIEKKIVSA
jgi:hypothetical protein